MRRGKVTIFLFTLLFAAAAAVLWVLEPGMEAAPPIGLVVTADGEKQVITAWKNEAGAYYIFLPGYGEPASAMLRIQADNVRIDGEPVEDGMLWGDRALDTPCSLTFDADEGSVSTSLTVTRSGDLPAMYIETNSGSMEYIHSKKGNQETGRMRLYGSEGKLLWTGTLDGINGRGNDWLIPKKSYSLQLSSGADLLEMGYGEKWILQSNAVDPSHLRNKLVYDFAATAGLAYSPESRWVDLYLNGEYAGLYLLCERNEIRQQRVWPEGEGKYLVSMDMAWRLQENNRPYVTLESGLTFRIQDSQINDTAVQQLLQSVENAICAEDGFDPVSGKHWTELIDLDSWARKYLVEEIFGNGDAGAISQYFYGSAQEGRLYAGPVWDFDISMGNAQAWRVRDPETILAGRSRIWPHIDTSWYASLYQQDAFRERMTQLYQEEFLPLLDTCLTTDLEGCLAQILQASAMNQLRWENLQTGAPEETAAIRSYMEDRIAFLNQLWLEEAPFCQVLVDMNADGSTTCFAVRPGEQIPFLPEYEPSEEILGWYAAGSEEPFDITQPIYEDMEIVLRKAQTETAADDSGEGISMVQYVPFVLLLGGLGLLCLIDRKQRKASTGNRKQEALSGSRK